MKPGDQVTIERRGNRGRVLEQATVRSAGSKWITTTRGERFEAEAEPSGAHRSESRVGYGSMLWTDAERMRACHERADYLDSNKHRIVRLVQDCTDVERLRQVDALFGNKGGQGS